VLTGYSRQSEYRKLVVAPTSFRPRMLELIEREAQAEDGHIVAKMNSLVDPAIIDALYAASQVGTPIELLVRGICCLRPGVEGLSENIGFAPSSAGTWSTPASTGSVARPVGGTT